MAAQQKIAGTVLKHDLVEGMQKAFLDYSMSVIVQRALPDVRDGLKPVHRRILYAMNEIGLSPERAHKKCAAVVGEVLGKYHPHGDSSVYDALVRLAQDFSMHEPLVDGQGNFGSIDGDAAAAYRYTEARLTGAATALLEDIGRDTVDFSPNFDGRHREPVVLPSRLPNLLLNGSEGIAVGMATRIPPHNLREVGAAICRMCEDPDVDDEELLTLVPGPDFPTGGMLLGGSELRSFYTTGRGKMIVRATAVTESIAGGRTAIVFTDVPYGAVKSTILAAIARQVKNGKGSKKDRHWSEAIADLRDESDRDGVRVVVELKRGADVEHTLRRLYKTTQLQLTYGGQMIALAGGVPRVLPLRDVLEAFIAHRLTVIVRRAEHDVAKARERAHILEGLLAAIDRIDEVIDVVRRSRKRHTARAKLQRLLDISERQAQAILDLRLANLTSLDVTTLRDELKEKRADIRDLEALLSNGSAQRELVNQETQEMVDRFGRERRTRIVSRERATKIVERATDEFLHVVFGADGRVRTAPVGAAGRPTDRHSLRVRRAEALVLWTDQGRAYRFDVETLIAGGGNGMISGLVEGWQTGERLLLALPGDALKGGEDLVFMSEAGQVKRTALADFVLPRSGGIVACGVQPGDRLVSIVLASEEAHLLLATAAGQSIRFGVREVPHQGKPARGVRGIKLAKDDRVVSGNLFPDAVFVLTRLGYGKRVPGEEFPVQGRAGKGVRLTRVTDKTGEVLWAGAEAPLVLRNEAGDDRVVDPALFPGAGRAAQGDKVTDGDGWAQAFQQKRPRGSVVA